MSKSDMSPTDVAKNLIPAKTAPQEEAPTIQHATILSRPDTTAKEAAQPAASQSQTEALKTAVNDSQSTRRMLRARTNRESQERAVDAIDRHLEMYETSTVGSPQKVEALQKIIATVTRYPKASVLNKVLEFFKKHKDDDWMGPMQALQGTTILDKTTNLRVRIFYSLMSDLASGRATKKTIQLDVIRNIFNSDDLVNWVAIKLNNSGRR